jgi:hypothetical protein
MPVPANYVQSLVQYAEGPRRRKANRSCSIFTSRCSTGSQAEEGSAVVNSSINGKALGFQITMTVEEQFGAVGEAIRELDPTDPDQRPRRRHLPEFPLPRR